MLISDVPRTSTGTRPKIRSMIPEGRMIRCIPSSSGEGDWSMNDIIKNCISSNADVSRLGSYPLS